MTIKKNIKLIIEYDGTNFCGWQSQKRDRNVQDVVSEAIEKVIQHKVKLIGSGRTDSGVHSLGQVANFKTNSKLPLESIVLGANANLPDDVVIKSAEFVPDNFNARFDAKLRWYRYVILNRRIGEAVSRYYHTHIPYKLNTKAMRKAVKYLVGEHNFAGFRSIHCSAKSTVRTVTEAKLKKEKDYIIFDIKANAYLHSMVRIIVGTLIEVGKGKHKPERINEILEKKDRKLAGPTAPAQGLALMAVYY